MPRKEHTFKPVQVQLQGRLLQLSAKENADICQNSMERVLNTAVEVASKSKSDKAHITIEDCTELMPTVRLVWNAMRDAIWATTSPMGFSPDPAAEEVGALLCETLETTDASTLANLVEIAARKAEEARASRQWRSMNLWDGLLIGLDQEEYERLEAERMNEVDPDDYVEEG